jgi:MATE family multidrug resistance protein
MVSTLGTAAQAAISPCTIMLFTIACVGMGMAQGVQTFVSQADGRGEPHRAGPYVWQTLYLALVGTAVSIPIAFTTSLWFPLVAHLGDHPPEVVALEIQFLSWGFLAIGPMTACAGLESFYNGIKRPVIGLIGMIAGLVVITVGNYLLIYGHLGFPRMGIAGSGIATALAWCARLLVLLCALRLPSIDDRFHTLRNMRLDLARLREIIRVGGPVAFQWLVDIGAWWVFLELMMPPFGKWEMAAAALTIQYMHLSFMPALGLGLALTTQVGNAIGAARPDEAVHRVRVARRLIVGYMSVMALVFVAFGEPLAGWLCFETDPAARAAVINAARIALLWVALFQFSDAFCIVYSFASRGAGDTRVPALLFAICCWGIFVPFGVVLSRFVPEAGASGPWSMCTLYIIVLSVLLWRRFHSGAWRSIRIFRESQDDAGKSRVSAAPATPVVSAESPSPEGALAMEPAVQPVGASER